MKILNWLCSKLYSGIKKMNRGIEVWVGRALEKLDSFLLEVYQKFNPESYITVSDAYALIGDISGFAEKLQTSLMQILLLETQTVLKDLFFRVWILKRWRKRAVSCIMISACNYQKQISSVACSGYWRGYLT